MDWKKTLFLRADQIMTLFLKVNWTLKEPIYPFFFNWTEKYKHHLEILKKNPWSNNLNIHQQGTEKKNYEKYQDFILSNRKA